MRIRSAAVALGACLVVFGTMAENIPPCFTLHDATDSGGICLAIHVAANSIKTGHANTGAGGSGAHALPSRSYGNVSLWNTSTMAGDADGLFAFHGPWPTGHPKGQAAPANDKLWNSIRFSNPADPTSNLCGKSERVNSTTEEQQWQRFTHDQAAFNADVSAWDVSHFTGMRNLFFNASAFHQDLNNWDVSSVSSMLGTFYIASMFNGDVSNKTLLVQCRCYRVWRRSLRNWCLAVVWNLAYVGMVPGRRGARILKVPRATG